MPKILAFRSSPVTLKFLVHNWSVIKDIWRRISIQTLLFWATLPTRQDGGENREKAYRRICTCLYTIFLSGRNPCKTLQNSFVLAN